MRTGALLVALVIACGVQAQEQRHWLVEANRAAMAGDLRAAEAAYEQAYQAAADDEERAEVLSQLGDMRRGRGDREGAVAAWARALELTGSGAWRGRCLAQLGGLAQQVGRPDLARTAYVTLAQDFADQPHLAGQALLNLCRMDANSADPASVIARLEGLLQAQYPSAVRIQARYLLVELLLRTGQFDRAAQVAGAEPDNSGVRADLLMTVAAALQDEGRLPQAERLCRQVLEEQPGHAGAARRLYDIASASGKLEELKAELLQAARGPRAAEALRRLADIYAWQGDTPSALAVYEKLVALAPDDQEVLVRAGGVAKEAGALDQAARWLEQALRLDPEHRLAAEALGEVYVRRGEQQRALEMFKRATGYRPDDPASARALGRVLSEYSLHREALTVYQQARERSGDPTLLAVEMGRAWGGLLDYRRATEEYLNALADPLRDQTTLVSYELTKLARDEVAGELVVAALNDWLRRPQVTAGQRLAAARAYLAAGRAEAALDTLHALGPDASDAVLELAWDADLGGDGDLAARLYELALGGGLDAQRGARAALRLARLRLRSGDWPQALQLLQRAAAVDDLRAEAELQQAEVLLRQARDLPAARRAFEAVLHSPLASGAERLRAQWGLADCLFAEARWDEAGAAYLELIAQPAAVELDLPPAPPGLPLPPYLRAQEPDGEADEEERSSSAYGYYQLAEIALRRGDLKTAAERFSAVAADYPGSSWANDALARVVFIQQNLDGAGAAEAQYRAALVARERGQYDQVRGLTLAIAQDPAEALADDALMLLADTLCEQRLWGEAVEVYRRLASQMPDSLLAPVALLAAAVVQQEQLQDRHAARQQLEALVAGYPTAAAAEEARHRLGTMPASE